MLCSILFSDKLFNYLAHTLESCNFSFTSFAAAAAMTYIGCGFKAPCNLDTNLFAMHTCILTCFLGNMVHTFDFLSK